MMRSGAATLVKFGIFAIVMAVLTAFLFFIFGQYRTGSTTGYSAVFADVSRLKTGQSVRVAGIRVGTVNSVSLRPDKKVVVKFDADRNIVLTEGTRAAVRYLNLVGDRYLELVDGPGPRELAGGFGMAGLDRVQFRQVAQGPGHDRPVRRRLCGDLGIGCLLRARGHRLAGVSRGARARRGDQGVPR